jgi:hypothetical protein
MANQLPHGFGPCSEGSFAKPICARDSQAFLLLAIKSPGVHARQEEILEAFAEAK